MKPKRNYKPGKLDECQTPGYALEPIYSLIGRNMVVCDPCSGEGILVNQFTKSGYHTMCGDIQDGQDFLVSTKENWYIGKDYPPVFVTNPPFSLKYKFLSKCYELEFPFALLMPVETIGTKTAQEMFKQHGIGIIWLSKRVNFKMPYKKWENSAAQFPAAWFTHNLGIDGKNVFYDCSSWTKEYRSRFEI